MIYYKAVQHSSNYQHLWLQEWVKFCLHQISVSGFTQTLSVICHFAERVKPSFLLPLDNFRD